MHGSVRLAFSQVAVLTLLCFGTLPCYPQRVGAADPEAIVPRKGPRIVFLGDSITAAGHFLDDIETTLLLRDGVQDVPVLMGLGLSSETASGLTEPDHPFPRPCIHERLGRVLTKTHPDVVVACYGINDGIYHPFSEERFAAYQDGMLKLIRQVHAAGARVILLTPPPYAGSVAPLPGPQLGEPFGYKTPDPDYDQVLARYAQWLLTLDTQDGICVIDVRTPMLKQLAEEYSGDPIHPNLFGHRILAQAILSQWSRIVPGAPREGLTVHSDDSRWAALRALVAERRRLYDQTLLWEIGHQRPGTPPSTTLAEAAQQAGRIDREISGILNGK